MGVAIPDHIALAELHFNSLDRSEFSRQLGLKAVQIFYQLLLDCPWGKVFFSRRQSGAVVSLCCVFSDYVAFQKVLERKLLPLVFIRVVSFKLSPMVMLSEFRRQKKSLPSELVKCHLGMIARDESLAPASTASLLENMRMGLSYLKSEGFSRVWASALGSNQRSLVFLISNGFCEYELCSDTVFLIKDLG